MALAFRVLLLLCGIGGLVTGALSEEYTKKCKERSCPKGWYLLNDRCFIFIDQLRDFADAEDICLLKGGNLASIRNALENALVNALIMQAGREDNSTWIGFHDTLQEGNNLWTDGYKFKFSDFVPGQPDNFLGIEDCGEINRRNKWNDDSCLDLNYFVCAKDVKCEH
ncbi:galactose-specific lectin nattectin-like [Dunckerocampus dactyliophorus]|uniref:galactose-specific lectin nattectin-like n=1 Tax=Dunckerocampus dactyliophorus TaxID=161453 RepID=UPI00240509DD|nr:galactose-specific lectin nattectin-like [Dunckerocampus dactyliophorus]